MQNEMTNIVNGVDVDALVATIDAVKADPALAEFVFRIENKWVDGGLNKSTVSNFFGTRQEIPHVTEFELYNDEPAVLLSGDKGPNPVENLLHALAGCLTTALVYHAAARGIPVDSVATRFEGDLDLRGFLGLSDEVRKGYEAIRVTFEIGGEATVQEKRHLVEMAQTFSPVFDVVTNGVPVTCQIAEEIAQDKAA